MVILLTGNVWENGVNVVSCLSPSARSELMTVTYAKFCKYKVFFHKIFSTKQFPDICIYSNKGWNFLALTSSIFTLSPLNF